MIRDLLMEDQTDDCWHESRICLDGICEPLGASCSFKPMHLGVKPLQFCFRQSL